MWNLSKYESFNAKYQTFSDVAKSFVINHHYARLCEKTHTLIMGPRGCGKTTILKMLSPESIDTYNSMVQQGQKIQVGFTSIYIPADVHWQKQLVEMEQWIGDVKTDSKSREFVRAISRGVVANNVLHSTLRTFKQIVRNYQKENPSLYDLQHDLCVGLVDDWLLERPVVPNFDELEIRLGQRFRDLNNLIEAWRHYKYGISSQLPEIPEYVRMNYFDGALLAIRRFEVTYEHVAKFDQGHQWALCFDELEIAPDWLQIELLGYLRSGYQGLLLKLTTSPIVSIIRRLDEPSALIAQPGQDYRIVRMWTYDRQEFAEWTKFSIRIIESKIRTNLGLNYSARDLFGSSNLDRAALWSLSGSAKRIAAKKKSAYEKESAYWWVLRGLADRDSSFKQFLVDKDVRVDNPVPRRQEDKDAVYKKIKPIVTYRYLKKNSDFQKVPLYFGTDCIIQVADGNPRALIGLLDELTNTYSAKRRTKVHVKKAMDILEQSEVICDFSRNHLLLLANHPDSTRFVGGRMISLEKVVDRIGVYFRRSLYDEPFKMDVRNTFTISQGLDTVHEDLLEFGLYMGAIMYLDPTEGITTKGLKDKTYRLSYLTCPAYELMIQALHDVRLDRILYGAKGVENQLTIELEF